jgi:hypothetical protein
LVERDVPQSLPARYAKIFGQNGEIDFTCQLFQIPIDLKTIQILTEETVHNCFTVAVRHVLNLSSRSIFVN